jgi:predicted enzyme related to lactoylglutathione lyase
MRASALTAMFALAIWAPACATTHQAPPPAVAAAAAAPTRAPLQLPNVFAFRGDVADVTRSAQFYRDALGASQVHEVHAGEIAVIFASGPTIVLSQNALTGADGRPNGSVGFILQVADINAVTAHVAATGGRVIRPANTADQGVRSALVRDPDGILIELIQR